MSLKLSELDPVRLISFCIVYGGLVAVAASVLIHFSGFEKTKYFPYVMGALIGFSIPFFLSRYKSWFKK